MEREAMGPLIALIGSDGAGKSTVGEALLTWMRTIRRTEICHLGKKSGDIARKMRRMPLVGKSASNAVTQRGVDARKDQGGGLLTSFIVYRLSMRRVRKFRRMMVLRRQGIAILADRYPQTVLPNILDGPSMIAKNPRNWLVRKLSMRERALYDWMVSFPPDLVIRLNVDVETAARRKPDHRYGALERKIAAVSKLSFGGAPILDVDSTLPLEQVLEIAKAGILKALAAHDAGDSGQGGGSEGNGAAAGVAADRLH